MKILVVDDDREIVELLSIYLRNEKFEIVKAYDGKQALEKIQAYPDIDMVILDIMMPKMSGIEVLKEARKKNIVTPIMMLTAKAEIDDRVEGLDAGADDYLTKPFAMKELLARVRAMTRRKREYSSEIL